MKKRLIILSILVLSFLLLACSKKEEKNKGKQENRGRYVENNIALPKGLDKNDNIQLTKKNDLPFLYVFHKKQPFSITGYQMGKDGDWKEDTPEWLKSIAITKEDNDRFIVFNDTKGKQYFYYTENVNDSMKGHLYCSVNGNTYKEVHPEGWEKKDTKYNIYYAPSNIVALENGTIAAHFSNRDICFYNNKTWKKEFSIADEHYTDTVLTTSGDLMMLEKVDDSYKTIGIDVYETDNNYKKTSYPFKSQLEGFSFLDSNTKKDLVLCNSEGVHVMKEGTSLWQTVLDGTLTSLTMQTMWNIGFVADSKDNYYVLFNSENNGYSFVKYSYDETIAAVPSTELTLYSLTDNATLRQAVAVFQKNHSDVKINFKIAMTQEEYEEADITIKEDYIKALNTELLAGKGPDIIVLDGLPADSFVEKGVLADLSDIVQPMIDKGELFPNIMNNYTNNGKIYNVPIRFSINLLCSRANDMENVTSIDELAEYAKNYKGNTLLGTVTLNDFIATFTPFLSGQFQNGDKSINKEKLVTVLNKLKVISMKSKLVKEYSDNEGRTNIWDLACRTQISFNKCAGFVDSMFPLGIVTYVKGSYAPFEETFTPAREIGINQAGNNVKLCKEFISLVLSKDIQKNDLYDGFPVNKEALPICSKDDRTSATASSEIENADGTYSSITFEPINQKQIVDLINACSMVKVKSVVDEQILKVFQQETKDFFMGTRTADETAESIMKKTNAYLNE